MDITFSMFILTAIAIGFGYELGKYLGKLCAGFIIGVLREVCKKMLRKYPKSKALHKELDRRDRNELEPTMHRIGFL